MLQSLQYLFSLSITSNSKLTTLGSAFKVCWRLRHVFALLVLLDPLDPSLFLQFQSSGNPAAKKRILSTFQDSWKAKANPYAD